ncbi:MAG: DUF4335 domain-containing protein [Cyanobacteriota bacterium]
MKQTLTYQPHIYGTHACRLRVEGFPDVSSNQASGAVGIVTGWSLDWVGHPQLEGRREHLQALIATVIPYARNLLSGVARAMGEGEDPVRIGPDSNGGHQLRLRSSQPDTPPLELRLDDAELADLVRVLDQCRLDPRLQLPLPVPPALPLPARELRHRVPLRRRLAAPVGGLAALALAAGVSSLLPTPRPSEGGGQARVTERALPNQPAASPPRAAANASKPEAKPSPPTPPAQAAPTRERRLALLRRWLEPRLTLTTPGPSAQTWQLLVTPGGEVVGATPMEGTPGQGRAALGLPTTPVSPNPPRDTLLVRGVFQPEGFWEFSPWYGW